VEKEKMKELVTKRNNSEIKEHKNLET